MIPISRSGSGRSSSGHRLSVAHFDWLCWWRRPAQLKLGLRGRDVCPARAWRSGYDPTDRTPLSPLQLVAERLAGLTFGDGAVYAAGACSTT